MQKHVCKVYVYQFIIMHECSIVKLAYFAKTLNDFFYFYNFCFCNTYVYPTPSTRILLLHSWNMICYAITAQTYYRILSFHQFSSPFNITVCCQRWNSTEEREGNIGKKLGIRKVCSIVFFVKIGFSNSLKSCM